MNSLSRILSVMCLLSLFGSFASAQKKYPETVEIKFESGKLKQKIKYVAYNDIEFSELYFENGEKNIFYTRKEKSSDAYKPDVYKYQRYSDKGLVIADGVCYVSPTENFYGDSSCYKYTGVIKGYGDDSSLISEESFEKGVREGESKYYSKEKFVTYVFKKDKKTKMTETDVNTRKVIKTEEYFSDGSIKK